MMPQPFVACRWYRDQNSLRGYLASRTQASKSWRAQAVIQACNWCYAVLAKEPVGRQKVHTFQKLSVTFWSGVGVQ